MKLLREISLYIAFCRNCGYTEKDDKNCCVFCGEKTIDKHIDEEGAKILDLQPIKGEIAT